MKSYLKTALLIATIMTLKIGVSAQENKSRIKKDSGVESKLWYGGEFDFGLSNSSFNIGISPMVGFKLTDRLSVGIRVPLNYNYLKLTKTNGETMNFSNLDMGIGAFSRYKIFKNIFGHFEFQKLWTEQPIYTGNYLTIDPENQSSILTQSTHENQLNLGFGYNRSKGKWGYEFSLLYNLLHDTNSEKIPLSARVGLNYNF